MEPIVFFCAMAPHRIARAAPSRAPRARAEGSTGDPGRAHGDITRRRCGALGRNATQKADMGGTTTLGGRPARSATLRLRCKARGSRCTASAACLRCGGRIADLPHCARAAAARPPRPRPPSRRVRCSALAESAAADMTRYVRHAARAHAAQRRRRACVRWLPVRHASFVASENGRLTPRFAVAGGALAK